MTLPRPRHLRRLEQAYRGMRIGLFGGSFNPAHEGHAHVAEVALNRLGLDRVWWLVTPQNPLKNAKETAPLAERIAGAKRFAHNPRMLVSDMETRWGLRFSVHLIDELRRRFPGVRFVWVMGSDNLTNFHRWRRWRKVIETMPIVFVARPGALAKARLSPAARAYRNGIRRPHALATAKAPAWAFIDAPLVPVSSTMLRRLGARRRA